MQLTNFVSALAVAGTAAAIPTIQGRGEASTKTIVQLDQNNTQFENIVTRLDGKLLATRLDQPQVWLIDPFNGDHAIIDIPGDIVGVLGISETSPDVYAINAGNVTSAGIIAGSFQVMSIDLRFGKPRVSLVAKIPKAGILNGLATLNERTVLSADSIPGRVWKIDLPTGEHKILLEDASMQGPPNSTAPAINGLRISGEYLYFTNSAMMTFNRLRIHSDGSPAGSVEEIASGFTCDDFAVLEDGTAFLVTGGENLIIKISPDGTIQTVTGSADSLAVGGGTSAQFGKTRLEKDTLFVTTSGDRNSPIGGTLMEPGKVAAVKLGSPYCESRRV